MNVRSVEANERDAAFDLWEAARMLHKCCTGGSGTTRNPPTRPGGVDARNPVSAGFSALAVIRRPRQNRRFGASQAAYESSILFTRSLRNPCYSGVSAFLGSGHSRPAGQWCTGEGEIIVTGLQASNVAGEVVQREGPP